MALDPVVWTPAWFNALELKTKETIDAAAALGYTRAPLTYYWTWNDMTPFYATAARHAVFNFNRVKANVQAAVDLFGLDDTVPAQFTPTAAMPGERITLVKLQQMVDALASVDSRIAAIVAHQEAYGPWAGATYAGGGPAL